jgi:putative ABC transport system permease protein
MAYRTTERTEARRAETRERITTAARELIAEGGYVAAQVAAVAERAGVAVGTVYRHFPSKSELFAEVFREASQHEVDAMREAVHAIREPACERIAAGALARKYWPNEDPIGKRVRFYFSAPESERPWRNVVGVIPDVKQYGLDKGSTPAIYVPQLQAPTSTMVLVVRTRTEPTSMIEPVRREILAIDPEQAVFDVRTMEQWLIESISLRRISMFLLAGFAALALLLAAIGIYGVLAQSVALRTHEIGIRMALGAQMRDVLKLILGQGMTLAAFGIVAGITGALGVTRLIGNLLFGVAATDPSTFIAIAVLLGAVAFLACYLPARRAAKLDPVIALNRP